MAVFTLGLLFAKYSLPEMHTVGLMRGVAASQCLFLDGLGWVESWLYQCQWVELGWVDRKIGWVGYLKGLTTMSGSIVDRGADA